MPVISVGHVQYWDGKPSTSTPPVSTEVSQGGYPLWQASVIMSVGFGAVGAWWDHLRACVRWWWRLYQRIKALDGERQDVLLTVLNVLEHPHFALAQEAVRGTATTLGFRDPAAWKQLGRALKDDPRQGENTFRHLEACRRTTEAARLGGSTLACPVLHLTVELAYHDFVLHPHKTTLQG